MDTYELNKIINPNFENLKKFVVGIKGVNFTCAKEVYATGKRAARWTYVNLYAPPGTKYSQTVAY